MPTHSKHNLIALLSTVAASPRHAPKHSMAIPTTSNVACAAAFFAQLNFITLSLFLPSS
jgi:hypothetical protein